MSKSSEALTMRLPMKDIPPVSLREKHGVLLQVASMGTGGASGLIRLIAEEPNEDVRSLLKDGKSFLERILLDIEHYRFGVDVWSGEKITYDPGEILKAYADFTWRDLNLPEEKRIEMAAEEMEKTAEEILPVFSNLVGGVVNNPGKKEFVGEILRKYRRLEIPYFNVLGQVHEKRMRAWWIRPF